MNKFFAVLTVCGLLTACNLSPDEKAAGQTDCNNLTNAQEREQCAHQSFTRPVGPQKLNTDEKGWKWR